MTQNEQWHELYENLLREHDAWARIARDALARVKELGAGASTIEQERAFRDGYAAGYEKGADLDMSGVYAEDEAVAAWRATLPATSETPEQRAVREEASRQETYTYPPCGTPRCKGAIRTMMQDRARKCGECAARTGE